MEKITSFTVDHTKLNKGLYVSRIDGDITTYDLRCKNPNSGVFMDNETMHTIEHLAATYLRNGALKNQIIYFGPMGCQTGFYLLIKNAKNEEVLKELLEVFKKIKNHKGEVFGNSEIECGNYKTLNLKKAITEATEYLKVLEKVIDFNY